MGKWVRGIGIAKGLTLAVLAVGLAACNDKKGGDKPTGQVVAQLDGEDITQLEVNAELQGTPIPPAMTRRDAEKVALNNIVTRRMLATTAEERELHKTPNFLLQERRTAEQLRVQALARDIAAKVATPTRDEADKFIEENPLMFRDRKFFILDQIQFLRPPNIDKLGFPAAQTMAEVEAILTTNNIEFRRQPASLDALGANPEFIREVTKVVTAKPDELFMFVNQAPNAPAPVVLVNRVTETRTMPFTGDRARQFAINLMRNQRIQKALEAEVKKQQASAKERVTYQAGWEPAAKKPVTPGALAGKTPAGPAVPGPAPTPLEPAAPPAAAPPAPTAGAAPAGTPAAAPAG
jgi:EpsD family peptidyl-prolyl cis-trans isomerase